MQVYLDQEQIYQKRRRLRFKVYFSVGGAVLILIGLFYALVYSPIFQIKKFEISGAEGMDEERILKILEPLVLRTKLNQFLGRNNLWSWPAGNLDVSKTALAEAVIDRNWLGQAVQIKVREREKIAIWCNAGDNCYWLGIDGVFFEEAPLAEGSLILTVFDSDSGAVAEWKKAIEERFVRNLISVLKGVASLRFPIKKVTFDRRLQEITVQSYSGPDLFFSIRFDPALNLASMSSLKETTGLKGIQYIDLRVENRIFYKL